MKSGSGAASSGLSAFVLYLKDYLRNISLKAVLSTVLFVAVLISLNYSVGIEPRIRALRPWPLSLMGFFFFYAFVFWGAWGIQRVFHKPGYDYGRRTWWLLLVLAPLFFAFKMVHWDLSFLTAASWYFPWERYALVVLQLPVKLLALLLMLTACRKMVNATGSGFFGFTARGFTARPYFLILLFLLPLIVLASTQHDFLLAYPKVKNIAFINGYAHPAWPWKLLYEISYGLDFVSIELFFRGFLVIGLARWAGRDVILPMAAFYCTIHFGKPLGECISSFFGGMALGVIAWRTRSILGGLIVHLGLAWLMELGGWIGGGL